MRSQIKEQATLMCMYDYTYTIKFLAKSLESLYNFRKI